MEQRHLPALKQAEQGKVKSYVQDIALAVLDCKETATSRETFIRLMNEKRVRGGLAGQPQVHHIYRLSQGTGRRKRLVKSGITSWKNTTIWILERRVWSMSLREMHEQQKQSSPREQLQELNRQSRTELENSLLKEALAMSSENCEELMKQSNQEQVRAEQNRQRDAEQNRKLISELKQSVELLKNSNELLQDAISGEIGSLKDEVKENTVQEVRKALQANIEAIQRGLQSFLRSSLIHLRA